MDNFSFNFDTMNFIKDRMNESTVEFMVYDIDFYKDYIQFLRVKIYFARWIIACLILIGMNLLVLFFLYELWLDNYV